MILTADLSLACTGYAKFSKDGKLLEKGRIIPDKDLDNCLKIQYIANKLKDKAFLPQKEVVLEEEPKLTKSNNQVTKKEYLKILSYKPNEVMIEVSILAEPKVLVLADLFYPGTAAHRQRNSVLQHPLSALVYTALYHLHHFHGEAAHHRHLSRRGLRPGVSAVFPVFFGCT